MGDYVQAFARPSYSGSMRGFQVLSHKDQARLEVFFLGLDFDQRQRYFGGGISDECVRDHCRSTLWSNTTVIARSAGACPDAVAIITAADRARVAELAIVCAPARGRSAIIADLLELSLTVASLSYSQLVVDRSRAPEELMALLDAGAPSSSASDVIRIAVPSCSTGLVAC